MREYQVCKSSSSRGVCNTPAVPVKNFDHFDKLGEVILPLDLLIIGPTAEVLF